MKRNKNADIRFLLQLFSKSQREKKKKKKKKIKFEKLFLWVQALYHNIYQIQKINI